MSTDEKIIIVGSGPAGLTAAIYAARAGLNPLVLSGKEAGGQLMLTTDVDDFPGFEIGIQGPELMERMKKQAERFGARFINKDVISVDLSQKPFKVTSDRAIYPEVLIIATGASAKWLELPSEQRLIGKGVSSCAVCDGFFFKDKQVIVVGGGDTAMREALYLAKLSKKVYLVHRRDQLRAQKALQDNVFASTKIKIIWNSIIAECLGKDRLKAVKIKNIKTSKITKLIVDGLFVAIGHQPNTSFLQGQLVLDEMGYIKVQDQTKTSVEGVFWAGDVADRRYKQAVTAAGAGCKAALDAAEYLGGLVRV